MGTNRIYTVFNTSDTDNIPIQKIANLIRYSVDGSQLIVEWTEDPPSNVSTLTHEEALALTSGPNWVVPEGDD